MSMTGEVPFCSAKMCVKELFVSGEYKGSWVQNVCTDSLHLAASFMQYWTLCFF